jgi:iron complex transport system substrate-binding protein
MQRLAIPCALYSVLAVFIVGWWMLAFKRTESNSLHLTPASQALSLATPTLLKELSPLQRDSLHRALSGDFSLIIQLINSWDQEAELLMSKGFDNIQKLSSEHHLQAQILNHFVQQQNPQQLRNLNCRINLESLRDDIGKVLRIEDRFCRFIPQTFVAASFLLAIANPREIMGLPSGMRYLPQLYPPESLSAIPDNIDRSHSERLFLANPHLAFVAPYSHPPALEALKNQNIQLYTIGCINNLTEIQEVLLKIGHASNHIIEAQLLSIFIEASLIAIDNRLTLLQQTSTLSDASMTMLYLHYHQHFMLPTSKCLSGQMLARALDHCAKISCPVPDNNQEWRVLFDQEKIIHADPECLLISTPIAHKNTTVTSSEPSIIDHPKALSDRKVIFIDETIQESPTQYIVLAYYDIYQAFEKFISFAGSNKT